MNVYVVLLQLAGAVSLLLWAVRMVRTGVERSHQPVLKRLLRDGSGGRLRAAAIGMSIAIVLQSSTAVSLLAAGFASSGVLSLTSGLAIMLGADLGSAIVAQLLSVKLDWLTPILLILGGALFMRGRSGLLRQTGRILLGIALILVSLTMISEATAPLRQAPALLAVVEYLSSDFVTAFIVGAAFTWLIHSSVAGILLVSAFFVQGFLPGELAISLVLGANLGGGLIALGLTRTATEVARQMAIGNFLFRGAAAVFLLLLINVLHLPLGPLAAQPILAHVAFNLLLLVTCLPLIGLMASLMRRLVRVVRPAQQVIPEAGSRLDANAIETPSLALASAKRELLRMGEIIECMFGPLMELYETGDADGIRQIKQMEAAVDRAQRDIKFYLARIQYSADMLEESRRGYELSHFAINLEYVGDSISKNLLKLAETRRDQKLKFSPAGWRELNELHYRVLQNMQLALNVFMSEDRESARMLIVEKESIGRAERDSAAEHLRRLQLGGTASQSTSNIHLETVRTFKNINSLFASVAYPILAQSGDLLDSRLSKQAG
ncbi:Na/Pi cotransporter family protein [Devosia sp. A449]